MKFKISAAKIENHELVCSSIERVYIFDEKTTRIDFPEIGVLVFIERDSDEETKNTQDNKNES